MATVKLLPTSYTRGNSQLSVSNGSNLYTDTSSDTYARITHTATNSGNSSVYNFFIRGFETNKIPEGVRVTNYSVKIKIRASRGGTTSSTGIFLCYSTSSPVWYNGSSYSAFSDTGILTSGTIPSLDTYTFPTDSISWNTLNQYIQNGSFGICVPVTSANSQGGGVDIYGAEIEVTYEPPKKYVSDTKLQYFWNKIKGYITSVIKKSDWEETDTTDNAYILNKPYIKAGSGINSIKENYDNTATGNYAHAEGYKTTASGMAAHAEGQNTIASGNVSHAEGQEDSIRLLLSGDANALTYTFDYKDEGGADYITPFIFSGVVKLISNNTGDSTTVTNVDIENKTITVDTTLSTEAINNIEYILMIYPTASGQTSHAEGMSVASEIYTHAEGRYTEASGPHSHAEGYRTQATGPVSHTEGRGTTASGAHSHAENYATVASGEASHAEGYKSVATSQAAHAEGDHTIASGLRSHSEGHKTVASGTSSHAEGQEETTSLNLSGEANTLTYTFDYATETDETYFSTLIFSGVVKLILPNSSNYVTVTNVDKTNKTLTVETTLSTEAIDNVTYTLICCPTASGLASHAEGSSVASGSYSHSEGRYTEASSPVSHAEGYRTTASNQVAHAEGYWAISSGLASHAENYWTTSSGNFSHAEGEVTTASGEASHAEGRETTASKAMAHAEGYRTTASGQMSHAEGRETTASATISHAEGRGSVASNSSTHAEGYYTFASGYASHSEGYRTDSEGQASHTEGAGTYASKNYSHAEGVDTLASGVGAHTEGYYSTASGVSSHAEGYYEHTNPIYLSGEANATTYTWTDSNSVIPTLYQYEHLISEGGAYLTAHLIANFERRKVSEDYIKVTNLDISNQTITVTSTLSSASAITNKAYYFFFSSIAEGDISHAENYLTMAKGTASHSEGFKTIAKGQYSHSQGGGTIASKNAQFVLGTYNIEDDSTTAVHPGGFVEAGQYVVIVGNGYADTTNKEVIRSNAHTLDWQGNGWYAGKLTVGSAPTANMDVATKQYVDTATAGITTNLSGLTDTTISSPANGQILVYDSTTSKWINSTASFVTSSEVNTIVQTAVVSALANYGDGDTATYGLGAWEGGSY